jgi:hypothetical protein
MIRHNSLFKFKDGTSAETIAAIVRRFRALAQAIPAIRKMTVGQNIGESPENFDISSCIDFDTLARYYEYCADPAHTDFVHECLLPNLHRRVAVQIDLDQATS